MFNKLLCFLKPPNYKLPFNLNDCNNTYKPLNYKLPINSYDYNNIDKYIKLVNMNYDRKRIIKYILNENDSVNTVIKPEKIKYHLILPNFFFIISFIFINICIYI